MQRFSSASAILGVICIAAALLGLLLWVPMDTETGLLEKVRRRVTIGDALAPTVAFCFVLLGGLLVVLRDTGTPARLSRDNLLFLLCLLTALGLSFAAMRWAGPVAHLVFGPDDTTYRALRDTAPWKFIGFLLGGTCLISVLICGIERQVSWRAVLIGIGAAALLILIYDVTFDDLILPPNGDV